MVGDDRSFTFIEFYFIHSRASTKVDFWNPTELGIFSELVITSAEFRELPRNSRTKITLNSRGNTGPTQKLIQKKLHYYVCNVAVVSIFMWKWTWTLT